MGYKLVTLVELHWNHIIHEMENFYRPKNLELLSDAGDGGKVFGKAL